LTGLALLRKGPYRNVGWLSQSGEKENHGGRKCVDAFPSQPRAKERNAQSALLPLAIVTSLDKAFRFDQHNKHLLMMFFVLQRQGEGP